MENVAVERRGPPSKVRLMNEREKWIGESNLQPSVIRRTHKLFHFMAKAKFCTAAFNDSSTSFIRLVRASCFVLLMEPELSEFDFCLVADASLSMMTRLGWINKATPLPIQIRSVRTQTIQTRLRVATREKIASSQWVTNCYMIHAMTTSEPEVICVMKQKGLHPLVTSVRPDSTGNARQQSISFDNWFLPLTLTAQHQIDRPYWIAWLSR